MRTQLIGMLDDYGIDMFGDAVRNILDPRLRGGAGRYGIRVKKEATVKTQRAAPVVKK